MTLPLALRNRLAELILDALSDEAARESLGVLAAVCADAASIAPDRLPERFPRELVEQHGGRLKLKEAWAPHAVELGERSGRAWRALGPHPLDPPDAPLPVALEAARRLFDARLYFEVHEQLEPYWMRAQGAEREALQGLIQIAVGLQHLANGNVQGARALLHDGVAKVLDRRLAGIDLDAFGRSITGCLDQVLALGPDAAARFDWHLVPALPAHRRGSRV